MTNWMSWKWAAAALIAYTTLAAPAPADTTAYDGRVLSSEEGELPEGGTGVKVKLRTSAGDVFVHLGPREYLSSHDFTLSHGEPLGVVGLKIRFQGKPAIVARELTQGERKIILRDIAGKPAWPAPPSGHNVQK